MAETATEGDGPASVAAPLDDEVAPKATSANMETYSCENGAIKDLSRGRWFLTDVKATVRDDDDQIVLIIDEAEGSTDVADTLGKSRPPAIPSGSS